MRGLSFELLGCHNAICPSIISFLLRPHSEGMELPVLAVEQSVWASYVINKIDEVGVVLFGKNKML